MKKFAAFLGIVTTLITIFAFVTGSVSIPDFIEALTGNTSSIDTDAKLQTNQTTPQTIKTATPIATPVITPIPQMVSLTNLKPVLGAKEMSVEASMKDVWGNTYAPCFKGFLDEFRDMEKRITFLNNKEYSMFKGTVFAPESAHDKAEFYFMIYRDGVLIYTAPLVKKLSHPIEFDVSIANADFIEVVFQYVYGGTSPTWAYKHARFGLGNATFYNK